MSDVNEVLPQTVTAKPGVVYIDHGSFMLQVTVRGSMSAGIRVFQLSGTSSDFDLAVDEIPAVIDVLKEVLAKAAEQKLASAMSTLSPASADITGGR